MKQKLGAWLKKNLLAFSPVRWIISTTKQTILPGFLGLPLYDVARFFFIKAQKASFTERASAIAFNFTMAIPPALIFLFTLIPYFPISTQFSMELYRMITEVIPDEKNNEVVIKFLSDLLDNPRTGLLSTGFFLAMFFSSNAVMGIMRSFDKGYIGFRERKGLKRRIAALRLTFILFILFIASLAPLALQGTVLKFIGIGKEADRELIEVLRWFFIIAMYFLIISFIYRYAPAIHKPWKLVNPGSIFATFLMIIFTLGFSFWVSNFSNYNKLYGSLSTILILMLFIFFNSLVLLIGFELNVSISSLRHEVDERNKKLAAG